MTAALRAVSAAPADPYRLDPRFERAVAYLCCSRPQFLGAVATALESDALGAPEARLLVAAAVAHWKVAGSGPTSEALVFQRLRNLWTEGKVTLQQIVDAEAYLDAAHADVSGAPRSWEAYLSELAPVLQRRAQMAALKRAAEVHARGADGQAFLEAFRAASEAERIGHVDLSVGVTLEGALDEVARARNLVRLPTGIPEVDTAIDGGLVRGALGYWLGDPKAGKSMALAQTCGEALFEGVFCGYVTLEVSTPTTCARLLANMTDVAVNDIVAGRCEAEVRARLAATPGLGRLRLRAMPPVGTTLRDVFDWADRCEQEAGVPMGALFVDYGDKLAAKNRAERDGQYLSMKEIWEGLRQWAVDGNRWAWTASQAKAREGSRLLGLGHSADSRHKDRAADLGLSLNPDDDRQGLTINVFAHRHGEFTGPVGKLPTEYRFGRVVPRRRRA